MRYGFASVVVAAPFLVAGLRTATLRAADVDVESARAVLKTATDPKALEDASVALCTADKPEALRALGEFLADGTFLERLNGSTSASFPRRDRLRRILVAAGERSTPESDQLLVSLAADMRFLAGTDHRTALIMGAARTRKPSPKLLAALDSLGTSVHATTVVWALAQIGTPEACSLLEKRLLAPAPPLDPRLATPLARKLGAEVDPVLRTIFRRS